MAEHLTIAAKRVVIIGALAGALAGTGSAMAAQTLIDPTRPPTFGTEQHAEASAGPVGPTLQSVLISPRRAEAIISGRTVRVGDKVGEAKVVRITETEVHLREGKHLQTLKLFPGIEKQSDSAQGPSRTGTKVDKR